MRIKIVKQNWKYKMNKADYAKSGYIYIYIVIIKRKLSKGVSNITTALGEQTERM